MRVDRLLKLADYLETVPRHKFDMKFWSNRLKRVKRPKCGFSGCAIGHAMEARLFRGFRRYNYPVYEGYYGFNAVAKLFEITTDQAKFDLFGSELRGTPHQVAKRIRKFVERAITP